MNRADVVILGAGPAGIAAAIELGSRAVVFDKRRNVGGLTSSLEVEGAIFDIGGHSFHTPHPEVKRLVFDSLEMYEQKREARCYYSGAIINYPFQRYFSELPFDAVVKECESGLLAPNTGDPSNVEEYFLGRFGPGISKHFLIPYNRKLWGCDLRRLSMDWMGQRVPTTARTHDSWPAGERKPLEDDTVIAYPARGGFGEILKALATRVRNIRLGVAVVSVDLSRKTVTTETGETFRWETLVSTIPINELLSIIGEAPASVREEARHLEYLSLKLVVVITGRPLNTEIQRLYTAEAGIPAHKIVINHNSSDYLRGLPHHAITGEISHSTSKGLGGRAIDNLFIKSLIHIGLLKDAGDVLRTLTFDLKYGYPVPTLNCNQVAGRLREWLAGNQIESLGRFGEWAYINSDEAIHRGLALGRSLCG